MIWLVMAGLGFILTVISLLVNGLSNWKKRTQDDRGDTKAFRKHLAKWEPLVLERDGTLRGVKRFANRARFLSADEPSEMSGPLVSLVALEEVGIIDPSMDFNFEQWKQGNWWASVEPSLPGSWVSKVDDWIKNITDDYWRYYRTLTMGPSSTETPTAEHMRLMRRVEVSQMAQSTPRPQHLRPIVHIGGGYAHDAHSPTYRAYRGVRLRYRRHL